MRNSTRFLGALAVLFACASSAFAASSFIIVDSQTGHVLHEQQSRDKRQIGSLTKIATAAVVLDWAEKGGGDLNQLATVSPQAFVGTGENRVGLAPGDSLSLRDLLYAALVSSDNIAAYALAEHVGQTLVGQTPAGGKPITPVIAFVAQMNALAKTLKMERTRFVNPHGIDTNEKPMPFASAEDVARLTSYVMNKASFRFYVSQKERQITFNRGGKAQAYLLRNTNELLGQNGIDGVKTGSTARAGDCVVLSAGRENEVVKEGAYTSVFPRHIFVVLLGSTNRFGEGSALITRGWQLYDQWAAAGRPADPKATL